MKRLYFPAVLILALLVFLAAGPAAAGDKKDRSFVGQSEVILVKAVKVELPPASVTRILPGVVRAETQSALSFRVPGLISELPVSVGQELKKGDLIARLETGDYENALVQARAALAQAQARQADARDQFNRVRKLWADQAVPTSDLDNARAANKSADEAVVMAKQQLDQAARQMKHTDLVAPFDGVVADKMVQAFQTIDAGMPVVLFVDTASLEVKAQLTPAMMRQRDRFDSYACVFPSLDGLRVPASLKGIGPGALPPARTYPIVARFSAPSGAPVLPGAEAILEINVTVPENQRLLLIPASAVVGGNGNATRVWIKDGEAARPVPVTVAGIHGGSMAVSSGISPGDWVITAGQSRLSPGTRIRIAPESGTGM